MVKENFGKQVKSSSHIGSNIWEKNVRLNSHNREDIDDRSRDSSQLLITGKKIFQNVQGQSDLVHSSIISSYPIVTSDSVVIQIRSHKI